MSDGRAPLLTGWPQPDKPIAIDFGYRDRMGRRVGYVVRLHLATSRIDGVLSEHWSINALLTKDGVRFGSRPHGWRLPEGHTPDAAAQAEVRALINARIAAAYWRHLGK